jgi:hypothetical protein
VFCVAPLFSQKPPHEKVTEKKEEGGRVSRWPLRLCLPPLALIRPFFGARDRDLVLWWREAASCVSSRGGGRPRVRTPKRRAKRPSGRAAEPNRTDGKRTMSKRMGREQREEPKEHKDVTLSEESRRRRAQSSEAPGDSEGAPIFPCRANVKEKSALAPQPDSFFERSTKRDKDRGREHAPADAGIRPAARAARYWPRRVSLFPVYESLPRWGIARCRVAQRTTC